MTNAMVDLTAMFVSVDDFTKEYLQQQAEQMRCLPAAERVKHRNRQSKLSPSEVITIALYFHVSGYRTFKQYYCDFVCKYLRAEFPGICSYNRFLELMKPTLVPLVAYMVSRFGQCTGISFLDSTAISVCVNQRISSHKVFKGFAQRGKTSTGWFYGLKVHLTVNERGELLGVCITPGNTSDKNSSVIDTVTQRLHGKLIADRGYISQPIFERLYERGVHLITKIKKNMKNKLMEYIDKLLLRKRALIENVFDTLKNVCMMEHSRHRSVWSGIYTIISALVTYTFYPNKPALHFINDAILNHHLDAWKL
jgi:hypothetical protein